MSNNPKVILLLTDGLDYRLVQRYLPSMPNAQRMIGEGFSGRVLPFTSTWGNVNFNSLLSATEPGTQYRLAPLPGESERPGGCAAERLWHVLDSAGRKSALIDVGGPAIETPNVIKVACPGERYARYQCGPRTYQTADIRDGVRDISGCDRSGWPPGGGPLPNRPSTEIQALENGRTVLPLPNGLHFSVLADGERLKISDQEQTCIVVLEGASWSEWGTFKLDDELFSIRFRLLRREGNSLSIMASSCFPHGELASDPMLRQQLLDELGSYHKESAIHPRPDDPDWRVGADEFRDGGFWVARAAEILLRDYDVDFVAHKTFITDSANHQCAAGIDPASHRYDAAAAEGFDEVLAEAYANFDRVLGELLRVVAEIDNAHLVVVGDHGICINNWICDINAYLRDCGWLRFADDGNIDETGSKVFTKRSRQGNELFINRALVVQGELEAFRGEVVDKLLDWRVPETGERIISVALGGLDRALLGYWGPEVGDIVYVYKAHCTWGVNPAGETVARSTALTTNHGAGIQTQDTGVTSNMGTLLAVGPSIAEGVVRNEADQGPVPIHAIGTSVAQLLAVRSPRQGSAGAIPGFLK